jgi:adenylylsulfate kinase
MHFDSKLPTGLMIGRFQPWHKGHRAMFEQILQMVGQVCIVIRDTQGTSEKDPLDVETVMSYIHQDLEKDYAGKYTVYALPNITGVYYGRDVGYKIEKIELGEDIEKISATQIRKEMGI